MAAQFNGKCEYIFIKGKIMCEEELLALSASFAKELAKCRNNHELCVVTSFLSSLISNLNMIIHNRNCRRECEKEKEKRKENK